MARDKIHPPNPASLAVGQKVRVKFSSRWYDAFVVTPWEKQSKGKCYRYLCCFIHCYNGLLRG